MEQKARSSALKRQRTLIATRIHPPRSDPAEWGQGGSIGEGGWDTSELKAFLVEDGHLTTSDMKVIASHLNTWPPVESDACRTSPSLRTSLLGKRGGNARTPQGGPGTTAPTFVRGTQIVGKESYQEGAFGVG
jgi:hypothetical protein